MGRNPRASMTALVLALVQVQAVHAGAWTRPARSFYAKVALSTLGSTSYYTQDGHRISTADFRATSLDLYGEYGIASRWTGIVRFPILKRAAFETSRAQAGLGDLVLELKYGLRGGATPVAVGVGAKLPTGDEDGVTSLRDQVASPGGFIRLPTGDGSFNGRLMLYASHSFHAVPAYVSVEGGYNLRGESLTDEYLYAMQAGYRLPRRVWLGANVRGVGPISDPDPGRALAARNGLGEGVQYAGIGIGAAYEVVPHLSLSFDVFGAVGRITNIYGGTNLVIGLAIEY